MKRLLKNMYVYEITIYLNRDKFKIFNIFHRYKKVDQTYILIKNNTINLV